MKSLGEIISDLKSFKVTGEARMARSDIENVLYRVRITSRTFTLYGAIGRTEFSFGKNMSIKKVTEFRKPDGDEFDRTENAVKDRYGVYGAILESDPRYIYRKYKDRIRKTSENRYELEFGEIEGKYPNLPSGSKIIEFYISPDSRLEKMASFKKFVHKDGRISTTYPQEITFTYHITD